MVMGKFPIGEKDFASFSHQMLMRPHFGPSGFSATKIEEKLKASSSAASRPIVLVSSAHFFNLGHLSSTHFELLRNTRDSRTWMLQELFPEAPIFQLDAQGQLHSLPREAAQTTQSITLETEYEYPPHSLHGLWVHPA